MGVVISLAWREYTRFIRQPHRVIGSIGQPLLFWLFLGSGFTGSFRPPGMEGVTYLEFFYPGVLMMMLLFASIFSSITIIEDRDQGFLQGVLVAPVPRMAIVLGKVAGGTAIAMLQSLLFLLIAPFVGISLAPASLAMVIPILILTSVGFTSLGFLLAWGMRSTAGFHAVMMIFLMPLWMLSGALFPITHVPGWMHWIMLANPVSHALTLLRLPFHAMPGQVVGDPEFAVSLAVVLAWALGCLYLSMLRVRRVERGVPVSSSN
ncbi:MAG: ABC transporter permease [Alphaproteobacteria bacterium]|nr:ABC transporter permease [Alphaproteobacteria bacterium]MBF0130242.1 ABC transporter permease [Alphaproteobacteria bacterium]